MGIQKYGSDPGLLQLWNLIIFIKGKSNRWLNFIAYMIGFGFKVGSNGFSKVDIVCQWSKDKHGLR